MDLNHERLEMLHLLPMDSNYQLDVGATERYTETLNSALSYFSSLAQSSAGWKRLSSASVRPSRSGISGSPSSGGRGGGSSSSSSPISSRHSHHDDLMANLPGPIPSSAASAAIESLLPSISVSKKSVPGKSAEIVRASITLPGLNEQTDLEDWRAVLECTGARKICMYVHKTFSVGSDGRELDCTNDLGRFHVYNQNNLQDNLARQVQMPSFTSTCLAMDMKPLLNCDSRKITAIVTPELKRNGSKY
ncbi:hypothetical protein BGX26_003892 [Mortierella sp. AD094]|nr:hypothetical protein BGX26_003892 [Mortierella sp. AD094]